MPAPVVNAMRTAKAHGVGPFAREVGAGDASYDETAQYERHKESATTHAIEHVAEEAGNGLFGKAFMMGVGGWVGAKTIGWFKPNTIPTIGKFTYAPVHALDSLAFKDFNVNNLKANYFHKLGEYVEKHNKKGLLDSSVWHAKADALGGAKIADAKWSGVKNIVPYMKGKPLFSAVMMGGLATAGAIGLLKSGKHAKDGLDDLIEVAKDLDGKTYSRSDIINHPEKLSEEMREIRANLKAHLIPDAVGAVGHVIENGAFATMGGPAAHAAGGMLGGMGGMGAMMGGAMLGQTAESFTPSLDFLKSYLMVKDMQADGKTAPPEVYATLLAAASPEMRRSGEKTAALVERLAEQYNQVSMSAKDLVHEVYKGAPFKQRIADVVAELEEEQAQQQDMAAEEQPKAPNAMQTTAPSPVNMNAQPTTAALSAAMHQGKMQPAQALHVGGR